MSSSEAELPRPATGGARPAAAPPAVPRPAGFTAATADTEDNTGYRDTIKESVVRVRRLRRALEEWRHLLAPLYGVLVWRQDWHPPLLAGLVTALFCGVWYADPPLLTLLAVLGMVVTTADYLVPAVCQALFRADEWTAAQEREFERICQLLADMLSGAEVFSDTLAVWKKQRPNVYFCTVAFGLCVLAWLGNHISNLVLSFIVVQCVVLYPGMRQRGLLRRYLAEGIVLVTSKLRPAPQHTGGDHLKSQ